MIIIKVVKCESSGQRSNAISGQRSNAISGRNRKMRIYIVVVVVIVI